MIGADECARIEARAPALAVRVARRDPGTRRRLRRLLDEDQPHRERREGTTGLAHLDWHVERRLACRANLAPMPSRTMSANRLGAPAGLGQSQAVPRQPHQHVGPGGEQVAQSLRSREAAAGEPDLAGLHGKPVEPFAMLQ